MRYLGHASQKTTSGKAAGRPSLCCAVLCFSCFWLHFLLVPLVLKEMHGSSMIARLCFGAKGKQK